MTKKIESIGKIESIFRLLGWFRLFRALKLPVREVFYEVSTQSTPKEPYFGPNGLPYRIPAGSGPGTLRIPEVF